MRFLNYINKLLRSKFAFETILNIVSVGVLSSCGLLLYVIIAKRYDAYILGVFNIIYALHIIIAQIGSLGIQLSSLILVAKYSDDQQKCNEVISSALIITFISASIINIILFKFKDAVASFFGNPDIAPALSISLIGLWCLIVNKLLLNIINGLNKMKMFALFRSLRYMFLIVSLIFVMMFKISGLKLPLILSISEGILCVMLFIYVLRKFTFVSYGRCRTWIKEHFVFGIKGSPGFIFSEMNTRVDVLMLGYFCSETLVGIYSFAAILIEGINQFPGVIMTNITPVFTKLLLQHNKKKIKEIVKQGIAILFPIMITGGILAVILYPVFMTTILKRIEFSKSWPIFSILMIGAVFQGTYAPFSGILLQNTNPGYHTLYVLSIIFTNIILNLVLIPLMGMKGAAIATSLTFILSIIYLKIFTWKILKIRI